MEFIGLSWSWWSILLLIPIAVVTLLYWYMTKNYGYWESRGVKEVRPQRIWDVFLAMTKPPYHELDLETYKKNGHVFGTFEINKPVIYIADPELVKKIFVKDFHIFTNRRVFPIHDPIVSKLVSFLRDEEWKRVRSIISPTFSSGKMRKMAHLVTDCAEILKEHFLKASDTGAAVDCKRYFGAFTLDTIASCAFGMKLNSQENQDSPFVMHGKKLLNQKPNLIIVILFLLFQNITTKIFKNALFPTDSVAFFINAARHVIQKRKEKGERRNDFLQLVMDAREGDNEEPEEHDASENQHRHFNSDETISVPAKKYKVLTEEETLAQCFLFFLGGYDTTASTLGYAAYNLALNPSCQDRLLKEVDKVWEKYDGNIDFDVVCSMPYLDAVVSETMRLFPIIPRVERQSSQEYELGDTGIVLPKETIVIMPLYSMLHDPEWYPDPETFDPERFSPENKSSIKPYTYLPFGVGPRSCLATRFALMEVKLCLVKVLRYIRFVRSDETKVPPECNLGLGFGGPKDFMLKIERRVV